MEQKTVYRARLDAIGVGTSLACVIHCMLLPVFFTTLPLLGIEIMENMVLETLMLSISLVAGSLALFKGYRKHHRYVWPLLVFAAGISGMFTAHVAPAGETQEMVLKFFSAGCIITAHGFNWKYSRHSTACNKKTGQP